MGGTLEAKPIPRVHARSARSDQRVFPRAGPTTARGERECFGQPPVQRFLLSLFPRMDPTKINAPHIHSSSCLQVCLGIQLSLLSLLTIYTSRKCYTQIIFRKNHVHNLSLLKNY
jgi:hypothetical protein